MMRIARYMAAVLCGILVCGVVQAEPKATDRLKLKVDFTARYTDNRDSVPNAVKEENWDFFLVPHIGYAYYGERTDLTTYYAPTLRYRENPSVVQNDYEVLHALGIELKHNASKRLELRCWDSFTYTDDPAVDQGGIAVRSDRSYLLNRAEVGLIHQITPKSNVDIYGRHMMKQYDESAVSAESDEDQAAVGITVWSRIAATVALQVMGSFTAYGFEDLFGLDRDFTAVFGGLGIEKQFTPQMNGGIKAGVQSLEYSDGSLDSQIVPFGEVWIKGRTVPTTELSGSLGHGVREAHAYPYASQEYTEARAGVRSELSENGRWIIDVWGVYRLSSYNDQETLPIQAITNPQLAAMAAAMGVNQISGDETTIEVEGGLTYRMTERCSLKLTQRYEDLDSDVGISFTKNSTALSLSAQF